MLAPFHVAPLGGYGLTSSKRRLDASLQMRYVRHISSNLYKGTHARRGTYPWQNKD